MDAFVYKNPVTRIEEKFSNKLNKKIQLCTMCIN